MNGNNTSRHTQSYKCHFNRGSLYAGQERGMRCWNNKLKYIAWVCGSSLQFVWFGKGGNWKNKLPLLWLQLCGLAQAETQRNSQSGDRSSCVTYWPESQESLLQWEITGFQMVGNPRGTVVPTVTPLNYDIRIMKKLTIMNRFF